MIFENELKIGQGIYTRAARIADILRLPYDKVSRWVNVYWDGKLGAGIRKPLFLADRRFARCKFSYARRVLSDDVTRRGWRCHLAES